MTLTLGVIGLMLPVSAVHAGPQDPRPRFELLSEFVDEFGVEEAVLDRETQLVWDRSPDTNLRNWASANNHCYRRIIGGRSGWRLPSVEELAWLLDHTDPLPPPTIFPEAKLLFTGIQTNPPAETGVYWTSTTVVNPINDNNAYGVNFSHIHNIDPAGLGAVGKALNAFTWCVRGVASPGDQ